MGGWGHFTILFPFLRIVVDSRGLVSEHMNLGLRVGVLGFRAVYSFTKRRTTASFDQVQRACSSNFSSWVLKLRRLRLKLITSNPNNAYNPYSFRFIFHYSNITPILPGLKSWEAKGHRAGLSNALLKFICQLLSRATLLP